MCRRKEGGSPASHGAGRGVGKEGEGVGVLFHGLTLPPLPPASPVPACPEGLAVGFIRFPCSEYAPLGVFTAQRRTHPRALNPKEAMWGLRASHVEQSRNSGAMGSSPSLTPTHSRSTLLHLSLSLSRCNKDADSLGAHLGGSAQGATTQVAWCMGGATGGELSCPLKCLYLPEGPGVIKEGQRCPILTATSEIRAPTKLRCSSPGSLPAHDKWAGERESGLPLGEPREGAA